METQNEPLIKTVQTLLNSYDWNAKNIPDGVEKILISNAWRRRDIEGLEVKLFDFFPDFCEAPTPFGLNTSFKNIFSICLDKGVWVVNNDIFDVSKSLLEYLRSCLRDQTLYARAHKALGDIKFFYKNNPNYEVIFAADNNIDTIKKRFAKADRARQRMLSKIQTIRPDLFEQIVEEKISLYKATIEAGFRKPTIQFQKDPIKIATKLKITFTKEEIVSIMSSLEEQI